MEIAATSENFVPQVPGNMRHDMPWWDAPGGEGGVTESMDQSSPRVSTGRKEQVISQNEEFQQARGALSLSFSGN